MITRPTDEERRKTLEKILADLELLRKLATEADAGFLAFQLAMAADEARALVELESEGDT